MTGDGDPFYLNFGSTGPRWSEIADFEPIFARSASGLNTDTKSTTRFPMSLRWSSYVAPKPQRRVQNAKRPISV